ncbi:MAG: hypothetical protein J6S28_00075 [Clostridia bacterium]|nr:hypothetical protein [Clostridia bacterium]
MKRDLLINYEDGLFLTDFSTYEVNASVNDDLLLERAWEHVDAALNSPKFNRYRKYGNALYCGIKLAVHYRIYIYIFQHPAMDAIMMSFKAPDLLIYDANLLAAICSSASLFDAKADNDTRNVHITFSFFD